MAAVARATPPLVDPSDDEHSRAQHRRSRNHIFRIRNGQVQDHWHAFDRADLMRQLGGKSDASGRDARDEWDAD